MGRNSKGRETSCSKRENKIKIENKKRKEGKMGKEKGGAKYEI